MSPEGLKLLKKALIGLSIFFFLLIGYRFISSDPDHTPTAASKDIIMDHTRNRESLLDLSHLKSHERSAKDGLVNLMHFYAYNYYRSNRLRNAINIWDEAQYLDPDHQIIALRMKEAHNVLDHLIDENVALGFLDYKYLRYKRAIMHWNRAANLVSGLNKERHDKIAQYISMAERHLEQ